MDPSASAEGAMQRSGKDFGEMEKVVPDDGAAKAGRARVRRAKSAEIRDMLDEFQTRSVVKIYERIADRECTRECEQSFHGLGMNDDRAGPGAGSDRGREVGVFEKGRGSGDNGKRGGEQRFRPAGSLFVE